MDTLGVRDTVGADDLTSGAAHAASAQDAIAALRTSAAGLDEAEARRRLEAHGPNRLPSAPGRPWPKRFLAQFNNLLIQVLIAAAVVTALLGHWVDTVVILAVVVINAVIGFVQEGRAEKALDAIRDMLAPRCTVIRDGRRLTVAAEELVPGDVVVLEPGDRVPADLRLVRAKGLAVQEAALTGESMPVDKGEQAVAADAALADRTSMAFTGTLVTKGHGLGVVVATGSATELGRISAMIGEVQSLTTPLLRQMETFARWLTIAVLGAAALTFAFGVLVRDMGASEMFMVVVGLAVAAIPEGLPAILTVTLAIGVQRMARRNAIIRRLPAVETLGAVSIICSDKTGTLTRNEMTLAGVETSARAYEVSGVGYDPHGAFTVDGREVEADHRPLLHQIALAGLLCNDAHLRRSDQGWSVEGDPMEGALLIGAMKAGLDLDLDRQRWPRTDVIPFDAAHRFMATLHHDHAGNGYIVVKGAPEQVLGMCAGERRSDGSECPLDVTAWSQRMERMAGRGQRVLAIAVKDAPSGKGELDFDDVAEGLCLLGLVGLIDPPREEAIESVAECRAAGVRIKMITGDHPATAAAIARQLGFVSTDRVLAGPEIDAMDQQALIEAAVAVDVFARTSPEHKLRLVEALQARGSVVAMTGDGVNDAPALKRADVGVAMGRGGTEAAKEAAEMVLADDNFASIARAVREGRTVYDNLKKAIVFLLPVNGGESLAIIAAILLGFTLPITPLQILWVNMVSSVALAMALAFEPTEPDAMRRPPRDPAEQMLSGFLVWRILFVSLLFLAGIFGMFTWARQTGASIEEARTYAVNTLVAMEVFYLFSVRYLRTPSLTFRGILGTPAVLIAVSLVTALQFVFTYAPFMERFFDTRPIDVAHGVLIVLAGVALFVILELEKAVRRRPLAVPHRRRRP